MRAMLAACCGTIAWLGPLAAPAHAQAPGSGQAPARRADSVTLDVGRGGQGRVSLPGGDAIAPRAGATLRTVSETDPEGRPRVAVHLDAGAFDVQGRGGGPLVRVGDAELVPGQGDAEVEITEAGATIRHAGRGPVILRLPGQPEGRRILLADGARLESTGTGDARRLRVPADSAGQVLVSVEGGWAQVAPDSELSFTADGRAEVPRGTLTPGATPPPIAPETAPVAGDEQVAAQVGEGGRALFFLADGRAADARPGAAAASRPEARWWRSSSSRRPRLRTRPRPRARW